MKALKTIDKVLQNIGNVISAACMLVMTLIVTVAVVCRHLNVQFVAADELARYVMIWSIFIGIVACTRQRGHARVTVIVDLFHGKAKKVYEAILQIIVIIALVWLTKLCFDLVMHAVESGQKAPITKIPYWFMYSSMVIGFFFSIIREIELFVKDYILKQPEPDEFEEGMVSE